MDTNSTPLTPECEALAALRARGIMPDDEAPEGDAGWVSTLEPHGAEPSDTALEALDRTLCASENDGRADAFARLRDTLADHYLVGVECHHESGTDTAHCYCAFWCSGARPSHGEAVAAWVDHVMERASLPT